MGIHLSLSTHDAVDDLAKWADVLIPLCSLNETSRNIISRKLFENAKKGAVLISVARSECVDHDALYDCLQSGRLAHAVLDSPPPVRDHASSLSDSTGSLVDFRSNQFCAIHTGRASTVGGRRQAVYGDTSHRFQHLRLAAKDIRGGGDRTGKIDLI